VLNKDKLKTADTDSLEKALGTAGTFSGKVAFLAERISKFVLRKMYRRILLKEMMGGKRSEYKVFWIFR